MTASIILVVLAIVVVLILLIWLVIRSTNLKTVSGKEGMIGEMGEVVSLGESSKIKVHGEIWHMTSKDSLAVGDMVRVIEIQHLTMLVEKEA